MTFAKLDLCHSTIVLALTFITYMKSLRVIIPHEEQGIKEFHDNEFLTRKKDKENKELASIKKRNL